MSPNPYLSFSRIPLSKTSLANRIEETKLDFNVIQETEAIFEKFLHLLHKKFSPSNILILSDSDEFFKEKLVTIFPTSKVTTYNSSNLKMTDLDSYELVFSVCYLHSFTDPFDFWTILQRASNENTVIYISDYIRPTSFEKAKESVHRFELSQEKKNDSSSNLTHESNQPINVNWKEKFYDALLASFTIEELETMLLQIRLSNKVNVELVSERQWVCYSRFLL